MAVPPRVLVVSRLQLLRQGISQRLELLGARVAGSAELGPSSGLGGDDRPDLLILDVEDAEWSWVDAVGRLAAPPHPVPVVLLARRMSIEEAAEAKRLGVAGVVLKPFREEEHMARLWGLLNRSRGVTPRRSQPRYHPAEGSGTVTDASGGRSAPFRVLDLSAGGACLAVPARGPAELASPGSTASARLSIGGAHVAATLRVVHRDDGRAGVELRSLGSGKLDFLEHLERLRSRVFGTRRIRGPW